MDIRKIIRETLNQLDESRMTTYSFEILSNIGKQVPGLSQLGLQSMSDGSVGLYRYEKDGNAYEIQIRPADLIKDKERWGKFLTKNEPHYMKDIYKILNKS